MGTDSGMVVAQAGRQEKGDLLFEGCRVSVSPDEKSPGDGSYNNAYVSP